MKTKYEAIAMTKEMVTAMFPIDKEEESPHWTSLLLLKAPVPGGKLVGKDFPLFLVP